MSQTIDGKEYNIADFEAIRSQQLDILSKDPGNSDAICELICADALLCEEYMKDFGPSWLNAGLCREIIKYADTIIEVTPDKAQLVENVCSRAAEVLFDHPRLKLRLMEAEREAIIAQCDERAEDCEMGISDLDAEIARYQLNILAADQERWDDIVQDGHLKHDPIEWSADYEDAISDAQAKADAQLKDTPHGMGFCHAWWHTLSDILLSEYGIEWRSPAQMNPGVLFD